MTNSGTLKVKIVIPKRQRYPVCTRLELDEARFLIRAIEFKKQPTYAIIFAFDGVAYSYVTLYAHAPPVKLRTGCGI